MQSADAELASLLVWRGRLENFIRQGAKVHRDGHDLVLVGKDGQLTRISDFFNDNELLQLEFEQSDLADVLRDILAFVEPGPGRLYAQAAVDAPAAVQTDAASPDEAIPEAGDQVKIPAGFLTVTRMDGRRVDRVRFEPIEVEDE